MRARQNRWGVDVWHSGISLPKQVVRQEIEKIEALGVTFLLNCVVGKQLNIDDIFAQGYDAIFIGSGTALPKSLDIPGAGLRGVIQATYLLHMANIYNEALLAVIRCRLSKESTWQ